jgi:hypothetical protein
MTRSSCVLALALACACPAVPAAEVLQAEAAPAFDVKNPGAPRRIMLYVTRPAETLPNLPGMAGTVQAPPGASAGAMAAGMIIGTLLIKSINDSQERAAREFSSTVAQALSSLDMRRELAEQLRTEIERTGTLKGAAFEEAADPSDLEQPGLLVRIAERDIFTIEALSGFDPHYTSLHFVSTVRLWRKDEARPLYSARLHYVSRSFADEGEAKREWIANNGALLNDLLREAAAETAGMFVADAARRASGASPSVDSVQASWTDARSGKKIDAPINLVRQGPARVWGHTPAAHAGELISLPSDNVTIFVEAPAR